MALDILIHVETRKGHLDDLLTDAFKKYRALTDLDRSFITELVYGTVRWQGKIDWILGRFSRVRLTRMERAILCILRMGVYQILSMTKTPPRAAVSEAVILAKKLGKEEAAGFVNGVLRQISRELRDGGCLAVEGTPEEIVAVEEAFPLWAVQRLGTCWGREETRAFCEASNRPASLTLRVNRLKTDRPKLIEELRREGLRVSPTPFSPDGIVLENPPPVSKVPLLGSGYYQIQDEAAQLIAFLANPQPGERILDACAAPGVKTTHLSELMTNEGTIYALDIDGGRLRRLRDLCRRMGVVNVTALRRDATLPISLPGGAPFDAVLVDAPCTGWGTIRRNPDIKWRTQPQDITRLASVQSRILENAAGLVRRGGRIVYSTCTVYEEENEGVIEGFLAKAGDYGLETRRPSGVPERFWDHRGFFRTLPHQHGLDGFFAARLIRF
jgi:16S rRNA (cytosine967-C5)-methyltransferase